MQDEPTPLFRNAQTSSQHSEGTPRHRREGHFDEADRWHDAAESAQPRRKVRA